MDGGRRMLTLIRWKAMVRMVCLKRWSRDWSICLVFANRDVGEMMWLIKKESSGQKGV